MAPQFPPTPQTGIFPPSGPTTMTKIIPSYVYVQYNDDPTVPAFFNNYNAFAQGYVDWFTNTPLGVYTSGAITGSLLDWVAAGLYGFTRPALSSGIFKAKGPYNTFAFNTWPYNKFELIGPSDVTVTSDDVFKRIITWNFYKGDGNRFNIRWLKRRIVRFLIGENGTAPNIDSTYAISITFGQGIVSIRIGAGSAQITGGAIYNRFRFNQAIPFNAILTSRSAASNPYPLASVLKEAIDGGVLQLPFQFAYVVTIPADG